MIDVTDVDMVKFVQKVYELSRPQGLGMMHFQPGGLSDEEAKSLIQSNGTVDMDYVKGRACKMYVSPKDGRLVIMRDNWYDHTDEQLAELLEHIGLSKTDGTKPDEHGVSCNCDDCRSKRGKAPFDSEADFEKAMKPGGIKIQTWNPKGEQDA